MFRPLTKKSSAALFYAFGFAASIMFFLSVEGKQACVDFLKEVLDGYGRLFLFPSGGEVL
jgi:hypothetical protein